MVLKNIHQNSNCKFGCIVALLTYVLALVIEKNKKKNSRCACIYCKNQAVYNRAFFFSLSHRLITPTETAIIRFLQPKYFFESQRFLLLLLDIVLSLSSLCSPAACPHRAIEQLSENALHSSPNKPQSDTIPQSDLGRSESFLRRRERRGRKHAFKLTMLKRVGGGS